MELMGSDAALDAAIGALVARSGADLARLMHVVERIVASWPEARG